MSLSVPWDYFPKGFNGCVVTVLYFERATALQGSATMRILLNLLYKQNTHPIQKKEKLPFKYCIYNLHYSVMS